MQKNNSLLAWVVTEGMAGTENQCLAVTDALGVEPHVIKMQLKEPWRTLSPWLRLENQFAFSPQLSAPWPDLLITSGRKAISAARYIKKKSNGATLTLHIQDPRVSASNFDLVAVPHHDPLRGHNVIVTSAAPTRINRGQIEGAEEAFPQLQNLPAPRIAVLIGGNSKAYTMSEVVMRGLISRLKALSEEYSLMITASRRTGEANIALLQEAFEGRDNVYLWDGQGENPYRAYLSLADAVMVSADSVSMLSDAGSTGKPVYIIPLEGGGGRIEKCHKHLISLGAARYFNGEIDHWDYEPLHDASLIAEEIRRKSPALFE